jgi:hypothetical protein
MMLMWWNSFILIIISSRFSNAKADDSSGIMTRVGEFGTRQFIGYVMNFITRNIRSMQNLDEVGISLSRIWHREVWYAISNASVS